MQYWQRKGEYSQLKLDGNNNSTMVRYQSNSANSTISGIDIVCKGRTRFDVNIRPSLANRDNFKGQLIQLGAVGAVPGDWSRKVFADQYGTESTNSMEYPPATLTVNVGDYDSIRSLRKFLKIAKEFSPEHEKEDFDEIKGELYNNIELTRSLYGKRSRTSFERG